MKIIENRDRMSKYLKEKEKEGHKVITLENQIIPDFKKIFESEEFNDLPEMWICNYRISYDGPACKCIMIEISDVKHMNENDENWWRLVDETDIQPKLDVRQTALVNKTPLRNTRVIYLIYKQH